MWILARRALVLRTWSNFRKLRLISHRMRSPYKQIKGVGLDKCNKTVALDSENTKRQGVF